MRRRPCAAALLCAPLIAGCGAATRVNFASHSRPASPLEVSVVIAPGMRVIVAPRHLSPGPVTFDVVNQSSRPARFLIRDRERVTGTPMIPPAGTAQIKAGVSPGETVGASGSALRITTSTSIRLEVSGRARTGDNELTQP